MKFKQAVFQTNIIATIIPFLKQRFCSFTHQIRDGNSYPEAKDNKSEEDATFNDAFHKHYKILASIIAEHLKQNVR